MKLKKLLAATLAATAVCASAALYGCGGGNDGGNGGEQTHVHSLTKTDAKAATCTTDGNTAYWYCSGCEKYFSDESAANEITLSQTIISAKGHTYGNYEHDENGHWQTCGVCGETTQSQSHSYGTDNICSYCGYELIVYSEGLEYTAVYDENDGEIIAYAVSGIGDCGDTDIIVPDAYNELPVTQIAASAFEGNTKITSVQLGSGITVIGQAAFFNCSALESVNIPDGVSAINYGTFYGCSSLKSVSIPQSVTQIGTYAFYGSGLTSVTIPESVQTIAKNSFRLCASLKSVTVNCAEIGEYSFYNDAALESVTLGGTVTTIGKYAFSNCTSLTKLDISDGVETINANAFDGCTALVSVIVGKGVTTIGQAAFGGCSSLESVYYRGTADEWEEISINTKSGSSIFGGSGTSNNYFTAATRYYYSESQPADEGNYWCYTNGEITVWNA